LTALKDQLSPIEQTISEIGAQFSDVDSELTSLKPKVKKLKDSGKTAAVLDRVLRCRLVTKFPRHLMSFAAK
jgi:hypothetical protein